MAIELKRRLFNVEEFQAMGRAGILTEDDRVELLDGEIVEMAPIGMRHESVTDRLNWLLNSRLQGRAIVRVQGSVRLGEHSEPMPDIALLQARPDFYVNSRPRVEEILLLVEVSDSTAHTDRLFKASLYAGAGVREYWLVDLVGQTLEAYRSPSTGGYGSVTVYRRGQSLAPLAFPELSLAVDDILG